MHGTHTLGVLGVYYISTFHYCLSFHCRLSAGSPLICELTVYTIDVLTAAHCTYIVHCNGTHPGTVNEKCTL